MLESPARRMCLNPMLEQPEPPALATVVLYSGSVQGLINTDSHGFSVCYDALVRGMNYSQTRRLLLWASLASQKDASGPIPSSCAPDMRFSEFRLVEASTR